MTNQNNINSKKGNVWLDFALGSFAGGISKTVCAPIERVKIVLQVQYTNPQSVSDPYNGIVDCFKKIYHREGFKAFWRGNLPNVLRYIPTTGVNFSVKDSLQRKFVSGIDKKNDYWSFFMGNLISGGIAGVCGTTLVFSLDFTRTRLAADVKSSAQGSQRQFSGLIDCYQKIYKSEGIRGLYRGYVVSAIGIFQYRGMYFGIWDSVKDHGYNNLLITWLIAQSVVIFSETLAYPNDIVRRRLMMQSGMEKKKYNGAVDCIVKTYREEGFGGFFKGNVANVYRSVGSALVLVMYDEMKKPLYKKFGYD